ncbi:MAG: hypothetical protein K6G70_08120, partial [Bacteroidaceae bacterium]|nr:hypothetical protein [Bacteroidaceae bacterium]
MDKRCTFRRMICGVIAIAGVMLLGYGIMAGIRRDRTMHAALMQLQADNQAYTIFTSDSAARALVRYFDHPWHNANDRLLAYYLLGRAHADIGEAPQAIEDYQTAIERADTTAADCDFYVLSAVYGQMAELFGRQHLYDQELEAWYLYGKCSQRAEDDQEYIRSFLFAADVYFAKDEAKQAEECIKRARDLYLKAQLPCEAAKVYASDIHYSVCNHQFDDVKEKMDIYEQESMLFDSLGNIERGREIYYYDKGAYYLGVCEIDSAELWFRKLLLFPENALDAYRGLLETYRYKAIPDSIFKYSQLFEDALSDYLDMKETEAVAQSLFLYNYNRHLRTAQEAQSKAQRRLTVINGCIAIILLLVSIGYYSYSRMLKKERKREHALNITQQNYIAVSNAYRELEDKYRLHQVQSEQIQQELQELSGQKEQLNILAKSLQEKNIEGYYYSHDLVRQITDAAIGRTTTPSPKQLEHLFRLFTDAFPHFIDFVDKTHSLTDYEWYVCIFTDL